MRTLSNTLTLGLDIGYGAVKAVTPDASLIFPSVCGHARALPFQAEEIAARHPGDQLWDDQGAWFVGDLALAQLPPGEILRLHGRTAGETSLGSVFRVRLAKAAFGKLLPGQRNGDAVHIRLVAGLPVDHMSDAPALKEALRGQHVVKTDDADFVAHVTEVMVMPQPVGAIYAQMLTETGAVSPTYVARRTGVVDVGTYTVDVALDHEGEFVGAGSGSVEGGVSTALERIAARLESDHRQRIPPGLVESTLRTGIFRARGVEIDYREAVQDALEPLRAAALGLLGEKWDAGTTLDVIYLSGGGAPLVLDALRAVYPQVMALPDPQFANARGYLRFALFREAVR